MKRVSSEPGIYEYVTTGGKRLYSARHKDPTRRGKTITKRGFTTISSAKAWKTRQIEAINAGTWISPEEKTRRAEEKKARERADRYALEDWIPEWKASLGLDSPNPVISKNTWRGYDSYLRNHILPRWGQVPLKQIARYDLDKWLNSDLLSKISAKMARNIIGCLHLVLEEATRAGRIPTNPATGVKAHRAGMPSTRAPYEVIDNETVALLVEELHRRGWHTDAAMFCFCVATGVRTGEARGLHICDIDLSNRIIHITRSVSRDGSRLTITRGKTHNANRQIPMNDNLYRLLSEQIEKRCVAKREAPVFPDDLDGTHLKYLREDRHRYRLKRASEAIGLNKNVRNYQARGTFASNAFARGIPEQVAIQLMGHADSKVTKRHYVKPVSEAHIKAMKQLDGLAKEPETGRVVDFPRKQKQA